jgi:N-carbamoylputrescine amidase
MNNLRIAAVVCRCPVGQVQDNLQRTAGWVHTARSRQASIICFPELNVTGYSIRPEIRDLAEPVPGPISRAIEKIARDANMVILAGLVEKAADGRVFASHLVVGPQGLMGVYRKLHIAPPEQDVFSKGDAVPLFSWLGVTFGVQLCYDAHFPELSTRMALEGADLIIMPHASPRGTPAQKCASWMRHLPARAFDNGVFVAACNQSGDNQAGLTFPGLALILDPAGKLLHKEIVEDDGLVIEDLPADLLEQVRRHPMRYFLPNRRAEIYCQPGITISNIESR